MPQYYVDFAYWLIECLDAYKEAGIDVYAISPQNEPLAVVDYNSCFYTPGDYVNMIKAVAPIVKDAYPDVKIMGPESMIWETWDWPTSFEAAIMEDREAFHLIDIFVTHLYTRDYQLGASAPAMEERLVSHYYQRLQRSGKELRQSEVCGWFDTPEDALKMGESIYNTLYHGNMQSWLHWELSGAPENERSALMKMEEKGKKYYAPRQFFRFIQP